MNKSDDMLDNLNLINIEGIEDSAFFLDVIEILGSDEINDYNEFLVPIITAEVDPFYIGSELAFTLGSPYHSEGIYDDEYFYPVTAEVAVKLDNNDCYYVPAVSVPISRKEEQYFNNEDYYCDNKMVIYLENQGESAIISNDLKDSSLVIDNCHLETIPTLTTAQFSLNSSLTNQICITAQDCQVINDIDDIIQRTSISNGYEDNKENNTNNNNDIHDINQSYSDDIIPFVSEDEYALSYYSVPITSEDVYYIAPSPSASLPFICIDDCYPMMKSFSLTPLDPITFPTDILTTNNTTSLSININDKIKKKKVSERKKQAAARRVRDKGKFRSVQTKWIPADSLS